MPGELELADGPVVLRHLPLALQHVDLDRGLVVLGGREDLRLLGRDRRVARDQHGGDAAQRLDAERERGHVEQQHVLHLAAQHAALDRGADRHDLVRVHRPCCGSLPKKSFTICWIFGMRVEPPTRMTSSISLGLEPGVLERLLHRRDGALDQVVHQLLELGPGEASCSGASGPTGPP